MLIASSPATLADGLLLVGPIQYPMYLVRDAGEVLLFEGGVGAGGPLLREHLAQLGIDPASIAQLVITHAHPDHVMAVPELRRLSPQVKVLASAPAAATMANEKAVGFFCKMDSAVTDWLLKVGAIGEQHRPSPPPAELKIPADAVLKEGDTVSVGRLRFGVMATPGHSDCHLSFYEPARRWLIASDATGFYMPELGEAWWPGYFFDYGRYMSSLRRLSELDVEILCLGHNAAITGAAAVRSYFAASIAANEAYHARIIDSVKSGRSVQDLARELGAEAHATASRLSLDFFQKSCGLLIKNSLKFAGIEAA